MAAHMRKHFAELLYLNHDIAFPSPILTKADDGVVGPSSDLHYCSEKDRSRPPYTIPLGAPASCREEPRNQRRHRKAVENAWNETTMHIIREMNHFKRFGRVQRLKPFSAAGSIALMTAGSKSAHSRDAMQG